MSSRVTEDRHTRSERYQTRRLNEELRISHELMQHDKHLKKVLRGLNVGQDHQPTEQSREIVMQLHGLGTDEFEIARLMGIPAGTLRELYWQELDGAQAAYNYQAAKMIHDIATNPEHPKAFEAAKFWCETRAGWQRSSVLEVKAKTPTARVVDSSKLDAVERDQLRALMLKMAGDESLP